MISNNKNPKPMTKFFSFTIIFLFISTQVFSQLSVVFRDDFANNNNYWKIFDNTEASCKIESGYLIFNQKKKGSWYLEMKDVYINPVYDFNIEAKMKHLSGSNSGYGLIWGSSGWSNCFYFDVFSDGFFSVWEYKDGIKTIIKEKTANAKIKPKGEENILGVEKSGGRMYFYINGEKVFMTYFRNFLGTNIGFVTSETMTIAADYIQVKSPPVKINLITETISKYSKENMGSKVNTIYSEIAPVIAPDGKTIYFARQGDPRNFSTGKFDIWYSELDTKGQWGEAKRAPSPLNNLGDNVVIAITPDNNEIMLEGLYNSDGSFKSDQGISVAYRTASGWSVPKELVIKNYYNKDQYESFSPTAGREVMIMSVFRDDSYGKKDLYVSFLNSDGTYSEPKNMGRILNSFRDEGTPYIAPDNKTLYFYSEVQPGYGNRDIFVSKRLDETWTNWSAPQNLGAKINSDDWDMYYTVSAKGDYAFLVSSGNSIGLEDLFKIKLRDEEKPEAVVMLYGKVLDKKTNKPVSTNIVYTDSVTNKIVGQARSNPTTGEYKIVLPYGVNYKIYASKKDYFAIEESFNATKTDTYKEFEQNLYLVPVETGRTVVLQSVHFYPTTPTLMPASFAELDRLADMMKEHTSMKIELHGHTESTAGYEQQLMALSLKRVEAVKKYLEDKGISPSRVATKGFGGEQPIGDNSTSKGRLMNRRVEFKIIES